MSPKFPYEDFSPLRFPEKKDFYPIFLAVPPNSTSFYIMSSMIGVPKPFPETP